MITFAPNLKFNKMESPLSYFSDMKDPRIDRTKEHVLLDIIAIAILAVTCGSDTWNDIEEYGKTKESWLRTFLKLPGGIPSHDTFNRVFSLLDPKQFQKCFIQWTKSVARLTKGEVVSIDGKAIRGSRDKNKKKIVHMVSAWAGVLGQVKVDENYRYSGITEFVGIKRLYSAIGCQRDIAESIISKEADYILALKGNQGNLLEQTEDSFRFLKAESVSEDIDVDHGRVEVRVCTVISDLSMIEQKEQWKNLQTLVRIDAERYIKSTGKTENETRYYISRCFTFK
jgi:predicted transposase YbfD/YdcC